MGGIIRIIGWTLLILIILFGLWLGMIFGPMFHISYENCVDKTEKNIIHNIRIYKEIPIEGSRILRQSNLSDKYDKPFLCVESSIHDNQCHINKVTGEYNLKEIHTNTVKLTGRVIKQYSFNAFNSDLYFLEVLINHKKYLISHWGYDDMTLKNPIQEYENRFKEPTCSIFKGLL